MRRFPYPLRYSIPAVLLILGGVLSLYSFQREVSQSSVRNEQALSRYAKFSGDRTSGLLEYLYRQQNGDGADLIISQLGDESNLQLAVLLDDQNHVTLATQPELRNRALTDTVLASGLPAIERVRQTLAGQVNLSQDHRFVESIYPVPLQPLPGEVRASKIGALLLRYDLATLKQQSFTDAFQRWLETNFVLAILCAAAWLFFDKTLADRAAQLVRVSKRLAKGELQVRSELGGSDELAQISHAFDQMAHTIQTRTEDLQASQDKLAQAHAEASQKAEELSQTLQELQQTQTQLIQNEKMSSLGQLVAGVAHEINNPVNFIYGNINYVANYTRDLLTLVQLYQQEHTRPGDSIQSQMEEMDLEFVTEDLPKMLTSMKVGADRIRQIVLTLRNFSRLDEAEMKPVDLHEGLDSTLVILHHRLKAKTECPTIQVIKDYGNLPLIECYPGQLNQVFMNILSNAIDALEESRQSDPKIWIRTQTVESERVAIHITDNGPGIPLDVQARLFDPFFTTKPVGKGTGLGMSISYQIVTEKHQGSLSCSSQPGQGADFVITIPIQQK